MSKETEKLNSLKYEFLAGKELSVVDICTLLNIKRKRVYGYLKMLTEEGFEIEHEIKEKRAYYRKKKNTIKDEVLYEEIDNAVVIKSLILSSLVQEAKSAIEVYDDLINQDIHIPLSTFYSYKDLLIENKQLVEIPDKRILVPSGLNYPLLLRVNPSQQYTLISEVAKGQDNYKALRSIQEKVALLTGDIDIEEMNDSVFIQYGRNYRMSNEMQHFYDDLVSHDFMNRVLRFVYKGIERELHVGMVFYSQDKDMLYLLGKGKSDSEDYVLSRYVDITNIQTLDKKNLEYGRKEYEKIFKHMFSMSKLLSSTHVEVSFVDNEYCRRQLEGVCKLRSSARCKYLEGEIIYTDEISDTENFMSFVRSFGNNAKIIEPEALVQQSEWSKQQIRLQYTTGGNA